MEKNNGCKFKVMPIDPKNKVLDGHLCSKCNNLLIIPFECENLCSKNYCLNCLDDECDCGGKFEKYEKMERKINERYIVSCNLCREEMRPNQFHHHLKENCKIEIKNNDILISKEENERDELAFEGEINQSEKEKDLIISCGGKFFGEMCKFKGKKSSMLYHQIECKMIDSNRSIEYPLYSRLIYLLIGVGEYREKMMKDLKAPPNDVEEMKMCLEKIGFEKNEKNLLLNQNACKSDIENLLNRLKKEMEGSTEDEKKMNSHSMIFFYFSGHGVKNEEKEVFEICPHDYKNKSRKNGINLQFLVESLFGINCMHVLIILDSCFGGGIFR